MQIILLAKDNKCEGKAETLNMSHNQQQQQHMMMTRNIKKKLE